MIRDCWNGLYLPSPLSFCGRFGTRLVDKPFSRDAENIPQPNPTSKLRAQSSPTKNQQPPLPSCDMESEYTRLHITPLNPALLATILPPSVLPNARNISYHTVETFPEKAYGYVELPIIDAKKIKKKLNGSILKGTKVRIEKARPDKEPPIAEEPEQVKKKPKKRKRDSTIPGVDIGERSVKRGWTVPGKPDKDKKNIKSKYTTGSECLFKTVVPSNVAANAKSMDGKTDKKQRKAGKEALVHEFSKTTKYATFLRDNAVAGGSKAVGFVEGKGWVDEEGNVLEEVKKSKKPPKVESKAPAVEKTSEDDDKDESSSEEESEHDITDSTSKVPIKPAQDESSNESSSEEENTPISSASTSKLVPQTAEEDTETSTSGSSSSESDSESDSSDASSSDESASATQPPLRPVSRPQSSSGPPISLSIKIPSATSTPTATVHPLEALYKKPKPDDGVAPESDVPSFSFFGADGDGDVDENMDELPNQVPLTPYTQRDFEHRGMRSAAPTPDTAHANKRFVWPTKNSDDEDEDVPSSPSRKGSSSKEGEKKEGASAETDFQKWFYENRGDTSRAWKKRRRTVAKEKRHRENRKRGERAV
ncbi:hypothetical protein LOCC1_G008848 [Lachnellula occidentalis]|uniref:Suppressor protein SRP40 n=1 Tax=Lachnellula occidentalis TaxID=215460 RepID=A0A8H8REZ9_9HELO|nr:hypothetical protein LOCC1_G008848 [Lachnellula occidentalis]